ncbi:hypothetical protein CBOM_06187 [Ceraceosorus bombacis]|uniref:Arrestin-like N-terminal domain-containing protein n=1 Tax=Ceraceosorus bombacis TaxID=401625 RepID=A0A0P1BJL8_9BASI|nr:hypothetical protein CBOM_06187 [Ceraceosorus bombacis]
MINSLVRAPCDLSLHLVSEDIFIHPPPPSAGDIPGDDKTLNGVVELRCPSERTIDKLKVTLQSQQTLAIPETLTTSLGTTINTTRYEEKTLMEKVVEITSDGSGGLQHHHHRKRAHKLSFGAGHAAASGTGSGSGASSPSVEHSESAAMQYQQGGAAGPTSTEAAAAEDGIHLDKGVHGFEFSFIIPSTSPPFERHRNGRVRYMITATAFGAGRGRSAIIASREVFVMLHVSTDGGPTALDVQYHDVHEALGAMSISLTSASLTVGGTANLSVYHPDPPPGLSVHVIRVFLEQNVEVFSEVRKGWVKIPTEKFRLWERGYMPYKAKQIDASVTPEDAFWISDSEGGPGHIGKSGSPTVPANQASFLQDHAGSGYRVKSVIRLPDDNTIRPSTVKGSRAEIRVSHDLGCEVYFSRLSVIDDRENSESLGKPKVQVFSMRRATIVPSCCCTFDTIHLPPYSLESPVGSRPVSPTLSFAAGSPVNGHLPPPRASANSNSAAASQHGEHHTDHEHRRLAQTLRAALPNAMGPHHGSSLGSYRSAPSSRPSSRDASPTRPVYSRQSSFSNFLHGHGRRSRNSSPERRSSGDVNASGLNSPQNTAQANHDHGAHRSRGRAGLLQGFTPAHQAAPSQNYAAASSSGQSQHNVHANAHPTYASTSTAPSSGTTTPRSLPASYPWASSGLPPRTSSSHNTCNCGRTTAELAEAEARLLEGVPTAPGMPSDPEEGAVPPPWTPPSRPASPADNFHRAPFVMPGNSLDPSPLASPPNGFTPPGTTPSTENRPSKLAAELAAS